MKIKIYTFDNCPYCERAKTLLQGNDLKYEEIHVGRDDESARKALFEKTGMKTFPQIFFGDKLVGGFTDLQDLDHKVGVKKAAAEGF